MPRKSKRPPQDCKGCGRSFSPSRGSLGLYCSRPCARSAKATSLEHKFWKSVEKTDGCWLWKAGKSPYGYGKISHGGKGLRAHRVSWELHRGPIPEGMLVLHDCPGGDNTSCVNPAHLWLGTDADNIADRERKGRTARGDRSGARTHPETRPRGEGCYLSKLTEPLVREIRHRAVNGERPAHIARDLSLPRNTVYHIVRRRTWKHVT